MKESYSNSRGEMDWASLGRDGAGLFRAPPELNFFCGPLERPVKERKKVERKKKADLKDDGVRNKIRAARGRRRLTMGMRFVIRCPCNQPRANCLICFEHITRVQVNSGILRRGAAPTGVLPLARARCSSPLRSPLTVRRAPPRQMPTQRDAHEPAPAANERPWHAGGEDALVFYRAEARGRHPETEFSDLMSMLVEPGLVLRDGGELYLRSERVVKDARATVGC